jgi:hypothetical protein
METLQQVDRWHQTRKGYLVFGVIELLIAYGFASLAINYAGIWQYALGIVFIYGGVRNLVRIFRSPKHERKH